MKAHSRASPRALEGASASEGLKFKLLWLHSSRCFCIQHLFIENLLYARYCCWHQEYSNEQNNPSL